MSDFRPDEMLTEQVIDGRLRLWDLGSEDSSWVVADLSARGYTVHAISEMLGCTMRHVKRMRASSAVKIMVALAGERAARVESERRCADALSFAHRAEAERRAAVEALEAANLRNAGN